MSQNQTSSGLLRLPDEVQSHIYSYCGVNSVVQTQPHPTADHRNIAICAELLNAPNLALLLTCRYIHNVYSPERYKHLSLHVTFYALDMRFHTNQLNTHSQLRPLHQTLRNMPAGVYPHVVRLELDVIDGTNGDFELRKSRLTHLHQHLEHLPNLRHLNLRMILNMDHKHDYEWEAEKIAFLDASEYFDIPQNLTYPVQQSSLFEPSGTSLVYKPVEITTRLVLASSNFVCARQGTTWTNVDVAPDMYGPVDDMDHWYFTDWIHDPQYNRVWFEAKPIADPSTDTDGDRDMDRPLKTAHTIAEMDLKELRRNDNLTEARWYARVSLILFRGMKETTHRWFWDNWGNRHGGELILYHNDIPPCLCETHPGGMNILEANQCARRGGWTLFNEFLWTHG